LTSGTRVLFKGALKSGVSYGCGTILALNLVDPAHFSALTLSGLFHVAEVFFVSFAFAEITYWKKWADTPEPENSKP